jgi:2-iminoacetate synthase
MAEICSANAVLTFAEYLEDFAAPATRASGAEAIERELAELPEPLRRKVGKKLKEIEGGRRGACL